MTTQEQVLGKISAIKQYRLLEEHKSQIRDIERNIYFHFSYLIWDYLGIGLDGAIQWPENELEAAYLIVAQKAGKTTQDLRIVSRFRCLLGDSTLHAFNFTDAVFKLTTIQGDKFDPVRILRDCYKNGKKAERMFEGV